MSITDELREIAAKTECANGRCEKLYRGDLEHIADRIDAALAERYVELPLDADGVTVHFGDVLSQFGKPMRVFALTDPNEIDAMANIISDGDCSDDDWVRLRKMRHYHAPTVEDVLRDMLDSLDLDPTSHVDTGAVVVEYAAKLRLAGDGE